MSRVKTKRRYVLGFAFHNDEVLLLLKQTPEWQKNRFNGVGGKVEAGETPAEAMVREFREEVGVSTTQKQWNLFVRMHGADWECHVYRTNLSVGDLPNVKAAEDEKPFWVPSDDVPANALSNIKYLIGLAAHRDVDYVTISYKSTGD